MGRVWFTADTHLGHGNFIRHCARPWQTVADMDAELIARWNAVVGRDDEVWHLGDFSYRSAKAPADYLRHLNGRKHLVWGNHDGEETRTASGWVSSQPYAEISVGGQRIVLLHYAMRVWDRSHRGALHFFGHSHGALPGDQQSCDVGVDCPEWDYRPVSLAEIQRHLQTLPPRPPEYGEQES